MRKSAELSNPSSCLNKARDDEPLFVLLGRDPASVATVRYWIGERLRIGKNERDDPKIREAEDWCRMVEEENRTRTA